MSRKRTFAMIAALLVLLAAIDFWQRIHVPRERRARDAASLAPADIKAPASAAHIREDLVAWLPGLRPVAGVTAGPADTAWSLALLGVFGERSGRLAIISATPAAGGPVQVRRVAEGDDVYGLRVARIEPRRVVLASGATEHALELFKTEQPQVLGEGEAAAAGAVQPLPGQPRAGAAAPSPVATAPGTQNVVAQELKAGEALELPGNMPVVEAKLPPKDPNKKKVRPPPRPAQLQNP